MGNSSSSNCAPSSCAGAFDRELHLYFEARGPVSLRVNSAMPRNDLLASIREAIGAPADAPLRLRDESGTLVAVSSMMPSASYYVTVEMGMKEPDAVSVPRSDTVTASLPTSPPAAASSAASVGALLWEASSKLVTLSDSGASIKGNGDGCQSWWAFSTSLPTTGRHYFSLTADGPKDTHGDRRYRPCCISVGFVPVSQSSMRCRHLTDPSRATSDDGELQHFVSLMGIAGGDGARYGGSTSGSRPLRVGILVDCGARTAVFVDHDNPASGAIKLVNLPTRMKLCINAPKHVLESRFLNLPEPAGVPVESTLP